MDHLDYLEQEAIFIIREAVTSFRKTAILFSGGKDSITLAYLAHKAFYPLKLNIPLLHIDTGHNFPETIEYRDEFAKTFGFDLIVRSVEESIAKGRVKDEKGPYSSRNSLQSVTLLDSINEFELDACFGGARRDEEKARAKERFFSHRDLFGQWIPKNQRPELWYLFNAKKKIGEHFRIFPLSNWTEIDVWNYLIRENIKLPSLYFSHSRKVYKRKEVIYAHCNHRELLPTDEVETMEVRFRTIGDMTCTGAVISQAKNVDDVLREIKQSRFSERGTRADDKTSESAMEDRKKQGYF